MGPSELSTLDSLLHAASAAIVQNRLDEARALTEKAREQAAELGQTLAVGRALALHAQADVVASKLSRAEDSLRRAADIFEALKARSDYASALALAGYVSSARGNSRTALESTYLAVKLTEGVEPGTARVVALNYLGVSLFWAGQYGSAQAMFDMAIWETQEIGQAQVAFHPLINKVAAEVTMLVAARHETGRAPDAGVLRKHVAAALQAVHTSPVSTLGTGTHIISLVLLEGFASVASTWSGDLASAQTFRENSAEAAKQLPESSWLRAIPLLAGAELGLARQDAESARQSAIAMGRVCEQAEHHQMHCLSLKVLCRAQEQAGDKPDPALRARILAQCGVLEASGVVEAEAWADEQAASF